MRLYRVYARMEPFFSRNGKIMKIAFLRKKRKTDFCDQTVGKIKNLRALYVIQLLILSTRACFQPEIPMYLNTRMQLSTLEANAGFQKKNLKKCSVVSLNW